MKLAAGGHQVQQGHGHHLVAEGPVDGGASRRHFRCQEEGGERHEAADGERQRGRQGLGRGAGVDPMKNFFLLRH
jgi:hypothetical protein